MAAWPEWLGERVELIRSIEDARALEARLKNDKDATELDFVRLQIAELERELDASNERAEALINRLYERDIIAATAASFRFLRGWMWKEIAVTTGTSENALRKRVATAFRVLSETDSKDSEADSSALPR